MNRSGTYLTASWSPVEPSSLNAGEVTIVHAVDYLLTPSSKEGLQMALAHVRQCIDRSLNPSAIKEMLVEIRLQEAQRRYLERIPVALGGRIQLLPAAEIERTRQWATMRS